MKRGLRAKNWVTQIINPGFLKTLKIFLGRETGERRKP